MPPTRRVIAVDPPYPEHVTTRLAPPRASPPVVTLPRRAQATVHGGDRGPRPGRGGRVWGQLQQHLELQAGCCLRSPPRPGGAANRAGTDPAPQRPAAHGAGSGAHLPPGGPVE